MSDTLEARYLESQRSSPAAYHLFTIIVEKTSAAKLIVSNQKRMFVKNWAPPQQPVVVRKP